MQPYDHPFHVLSFIRRDRPYVTHTHTKSTFSIRIELFVSASSFSAYDNTFAVLVQCVHTASHDSSEFTIIAGCHYYYYFRCTKRRVNNFGLIKLLYDYDTSTQIHTHRHSPPLTTLPSPPRCSHKFTSLQAQRQLGNPATYRSVTCKYSR